jgi:hypothetical protein
MSSDFHIFDATNSHKVEQPHTHGYGGLFPNNSLQIFDRLKVVTTDISWYSPNIA